MMTSPISASTSRPGRGFTLVELLVVIGIIVVLAGLLLPTLGRAWRQASRTATANDLQTIGTALEAYRQDFHSYPPVRVATDKTVPGDALRPNPMTGAQVLCFALLGPAMAMEPATSVAAGLRLAQDGAAGFGFRARAEYVGAGKDSKKGTQDDEMRGTVTPAYLPPDRFRYGNPEGTASPVTDLTNVLRFCLLDSNSQPILYFPASQAKPNVTIAPAAGGVPPYVTASPANTPAESESARYDANDNLVWFTDDPRVTLAKTPAQQATDLTTNGPKALKRLRAMLGDYHNAAVPPTGDTSTPDGVIQPYEKAVDQPFLLWAAGPDERFGPPPEFSAGNDLAPGDRRLAERCDDVTSFPR